MFFLVLIMSVPVLGSTRFFKRIIFFCPSTCVWMDCLFYWPLS